jgi:transposase
MDADFIRVFYEFGFTKKQLAQEYQVHVDTIRNVISGKSFQGITQRSRHRKLNDDQVRQVRAWAAQGLGEVKISKLLGGLIGHSTVRQVMNRESYQEIV